MPSSRHPRKRSDEDQSWREIFREYAVYSQAGLMFPTAVAVGLVAGYLLDGWLATTPWLTLAGVVLGVAAAIVNLYKTLATEDRRHEGGGR